MEALENRIIARIAQAERRRLILFRIPFMAAAAMTAALLSVPAWRELQAEMAQTGFLRFLSLMASDIQLLPLIWKDLGLLVLESLPVFGLAALLATVLSFLASFGSLFRDLSSLKLRPIRNT